jgi:hypothetical protein
MFRLWISYSLHRSQPGWLQIDMESATQKLTGGPRYMWMYLALDLVESSGTGGKQTGIDNLQANGQNTSAVQPATRVSGSHSKTL